MAKVVKIKTSNTPNRDSISVEFPDRCINCGKPGERAMEFEVNKVVKTGEAASDVKTIPLEPLSVPYCDEHGKQLEQRRKRLESIFNRVAFITWALILIPLFIFLWDPVYEWFIDGIVSQFGRLAPVASFVGTVIAISLVIALIPAVLVGLIAKWVVGIFLPNPAALSIFSATGYLRMRFTNEEFGDEFERLNTGQLA